ncbi:hypothetical protein B0H11DRAFT_2241124 [Mycena galericulata]|nr:hypothetical protein B0H11DRAFT_2241124 [Mycena galericulata]
MPNARYLPRICPSSSRFATSTSRLSSCYIDSIPSSSCSRSVILTRKWSCLDGPVSCPRSNGLVLGLLFFPSNGFTPITHRPSPSHSAFVRAFLFHPYSTPVVLYVDLPIPTHTTADSHRTYDSVVNPVRLTLLTFLTLPCPSSLPSISIEPPMYLYITVLLLISFSSTFVARVSSVSSCLDSLPRTPHVSLRITPFGLAFPRTRALTPARARPVD